MTEPFVHNCFQTALHHIMWHLCILFVCCHVLATANAPSVAMQKCPSRSAPHGEEHDGDVVMFLQRSSQLEQSNSALRHESKAVLRLASAQAQHKRRNAYSNLRTISIASIVRANQTNVRRIHGEGHEKTKSQLDLILHRPASPPDAPTKTEDVLSFSKQEYFLSADFSNVARWSLVALWSSLWLVCHLWSHRQIRMLSLAFLSFILVASPAVTQLTGPCFLYGPWNMFHVYVGLTDMRLNRAGIVGAFVGAVVAAGLAFRSRNALEDTLQPKEPARSLALIRIVLPVALLLFSSRFQTLLIEGVPGMPASGGLACVAILCVFLGWYSRLSCIVLGSCCTLALSDPRYRHHYWHSLTILFCILAFTPCDACFSLRSFCESSAGAVVSPKMQSKYEAFWAKPLIILHMGLVYFFAGLDKCRGAWISGEALHKVIMLRCPFGHFLAQLLPNKEVRLFVFGSASCICIVLELLLPFALWRKRSGPYAVALGFILHFGMSLTCGSLAVFTQVSWLCLIACLDDDMVNKHLHNWPAFTVAVLGLLFAMSSAHYFETLGPSR